MTQLLLSVRDAEEARTALAAGAALIDCKEPLEGALGMPSREAVEEIIREIAGRVPISVALGELRDIAPGSPCPPASLSPCSLPGLRYAKVGIAGLASDATWPRRWLRWVESLPATVTPVAVIYADAAGCGAPRAADVLEIAFASRAAAVLIDTYDKSRGDLWQYVTPPELARLLAMICDRGLLSVVGGSLGMKSLAPLIELRPDFVAVRGAACRPDRSGRLCLEAAQALLATIAQGEGENHAGHRDRPRRAEGATRDERFDANAKRL